MDKPKELPIKKCPFGCDADIELHLRKRDFPTKKGIVKAQIWVYECPECKQGFTTTKSDTITMNNLKKL